MPSDKDKSHFTRIDEGVFVDKDKNVYEEKDGKMEPTGVKLGPTGIEARGPPETDLAQAMPMPRFDKHALDVTLENQKALADLVKSHMTEGHHYGQFPGWKGPRLLKPGAELILTGFRLYAEPVRIDRNEDDDGHSRYTVVSEIHPMGSRRDVVVATGVGVASTREVKYAYRWVKEEEVPGELDKATLRTKRDYRSQLVYRVPNEELGDLENTIVKMAKKRAMIDAVMALPGCSELFPEKDNGDEKKA